MPSLEHARAHWRALAALTDNIFSTWEWADIWARHLGPPQGLQILALTRDHDVVGIVPLVHSRGWGGDVSRFVGHGVADELGPICSAKDARWVLQTTVSSLPPAGVLLADRLRSDDSDHLPALTAHQVLEEPSPVIDLSQYDDWDAYLASRSKNLRRQERRRRRVLEEDFGLTFRLAQDPDRLDTDFGALLALHQEHWGTRTTAFRGPREAFHREFAACALERGWLRLWLAEVDGTPVAASYGFRFGRAEYAYQSGRAAEWNPRSVESVLFNHTIRDAFAAGMREYRLLRGGEAYKWRYATGNVRLLTTAAGRGPLGGIRARGVALLGASARGRRALRLEQP